MTSVPISLRVENQGPSIENLVEDAAHYLPEQAPLHAFVHHNTLHAFEDQPFEKAVLKAADLFGTEPFMTEEAFAECLCSGRIRGRDLESVVRDSIRGRDSVVFPGGPLRSAYRLTRLNHLFKVPRGPALVWSLSEGNVLDDFWPEVPTTRRANLLAQVSAAGTNRRTFLESLWRALAAAQTPPEGAPVARPRRRDQLLAVTGIDTDVSTHPLLIRFAAAFLDQGIAYWEMPGRERGMLSAFRRLYGLPVAPPDRDLMGLARELARQEREGWQAEQVILWALDRLAMGPDDWSTVIRATLLSLPGWAGMVRHLEVRPDRAPVRDPGSRLMDYLAIVMTLDVVAAENVLRRELGHRATFTTLSEEFAKHRGPSTQLGDELVYEAFLMAQLADVNVAELMAGHCDAWLREVSSFAQKDRRWLLHLAYERRHRIEVLDGLTAHCAQAHPQPRPEFQAWFCIDDREESLRRHLEECYPAVETFGYAGFFGVAMNYQGLEDVRSRPLCPVTIRPRHLVLEKAAGADAGRFRRLRRSQGRLSHALSVASMSLTRGGVLTALLGFFATIPLVLRSLFPRLAQRLSHGVTHALVAPPGTRLGLDAAVEEPVHKEQEGYRPNEMVDIVESALRTMGAIDSFCDLVLIVGHGSSSLNNPHEAAHDCGATGGGRGGPNARAFAAMANRQDVREALRDRGIQLDARTWFVGAYHNTCDDSMTYYDTDLVPAANQALFQRAETALEEACQHDAHERCRRFELSAPDLPLSRALAHAETHANDLAEPRPEYGHATNAVCIVGRRERTRGLFLDRRAFLVSYDPTRDEDGGLLTRLLLSVGPVGAGINLEYYFSFVDPKGYGSGTKLPHNISGLVGVMDGHATDLRTGLPWQMVEIHEPVRLLTIVEAKRERLEEILASQPALHGLVANGWIQFVAWDPDSPELAVFSKGALRTYRGEQESVPVVARSQDHYRGKRGHLGPATVLAAFGGAAR